MLDIFCVLKYLHEFTINISTCIRITLFWCGGVRYSAQQTPKNRIEKINNTKTRQSKQQQKNHSYIKSEIEQIILIIIQTKKNCMRQIYAMFEISGLITYTFYRSSVCRSFFCTNERISYSEFNRKHRTKFVKSTLKSRD